MNSPAAGLLYIVGTLKKRYIAANCVFTDPLPGDDTDENHGHTESCF